MTQDHELIYEQIRAMGATPEEVFRAAQVAWNTPILSLRAVRGVFSLGLASAVQAMQRAQSVERPMFEREEVLLTLVRQLWHP